MMRKGKKQRVMFEVGISDLWSLWEEALGCPYPFRSSADSLGKCSIFLHYHPQNEAIFFFFLSCLTRKMVNWAIKATSGARENILRSCCLSPFRSVVSNCVKGGSVRVRGLDT